MTQHLIDISPDSSKPEGGHAIVLVRAIKEMPEPLNISISALHDNADRHDAHEAWTLDDEHPLTARLVADGLELQIGPDLVDAPELQPGTPVVFSIPSAAVQAELLWPDLPVTIPPNLADPVMDPALLRALKIENAQRVAAEAEAAKALERNIAASIERETKARQAPVDAQPLNLAHLADVSATIAKTKVPTKAAATMAAKAPKLQSIPLNLAMDPANDVALPAKLDTGTIPSTASLTASPPDKLSTSQDVVAPHQHDTSNRRNWLSLVLALIAVPAILFAFWPSISSRIGDQAGVKGASETLASADWVTHILGVGDISPDGVDASRVSASEALKRAEAAIFSADGSTNLAERKFWLRKSISLLLAEPETRWAVTQLGTLHTAPSAPKQQPDYHSAKALWELASASGDTVATCFLAQLYELGLGIIASKEKAQQWHERAAQRGGCNVQRERPKSTLTN